MNNWPALLQVNGALPESSPWTGYLKVVLLLAGILCLCYLLLRFLGQRLDGVRHRGRSGALEVIDRLGLEPRRTLYVIRAGERYMALASSETGVRLLAELSPDALIPQSRVPQAERETS